MLKNYCGLKVNVIHLNFEMIISVGSTKLVRPTVLWLLSVGSHEFIFDSILIF